MKIKFISCLSYFILFIFSYSFVIYINGNRAVTDITVNDGYWHFICITWENRFGLWRVFMDGVVRDNGTSLATGTEIEGTND